MHWWPDWWCDRHPIFRLLVFFCVSSWKYGGNITKIVHDCRLQVGQIWQFWKIRSFGCRPSSHMTWKCLEFWALNFFFLLNHQIWLTCFSSSYTRDKFIVYHFTIYNMSCLEGTIRRKWKQWVKIWIIWMQAKPDLSWMIRMGWYKDTQALN